MEQLQKIFTNILDAIVAHGPKYLGALLIIIIGWIIARYASRAVQKVLETIKIDKLTEKLQEIDIFSKIGGDFKASAILAKLLYYSLLLIFVMAASDSVGLVMVSNGIVAIINYLPRLITAMAMFIGGLLLSNSIKNIIQTAFKSLAIPSGTIISNAIFYFLLVTISITSLEQAGLNTDFLTQNLQIILSGLVIAFAVGFGFSSRDVLKNLLASSYTKKRFQLGMIIKIGDYKGTVCEIDSATITLLLDESGRKLVIPQHDIINSKIEIFE